MEGEYLLVQGFLELGDFHTSLDGKHDVLLPERDMHKKTLLLFDFANWESINLSHTLSWDG
jgi:hypothetical protein